MIKAAEDGTPCHDTAPRIHVGDRWLDRFVPTGRAALVAGKMRSPGLSSAWPTVPTHTDRSKLHHASLVGWMHLAPISKLPVTIVGVLS